MNRLTRRGFVKLAGALPLLPLVTFADDSVTRHARSLHLRIAHRTAYELPGLPEEYCALFQYRGELYDYFERHYEPYSIERLAKFTRRARDAADRLIEAKLRASRSGWPPDTGLSWHIAGIFD